MIEVYETNQFWIAVGFALIVAIFASFFVLKSLKKLAYENIKRNPDNLALTTHGHWSFQTFINIWLNI